MVGYVVIFKGIDHEDQRIPNATSYSTIDGMVTFINENQDVLYELDESLFGGCYRVGQAEYVP